MYLNTDHLNRCIETLESSLELLKKEVPGSIPYEVFRNAVVKGFELTLETSGKLLRKALKDYIGNPKAIDELFFKDVLRQAGQHGLLDTDAVQRWFIYRNNRNDTAHDYGASFADETLVLIPEFIRDAKTLSQLLTERFKVEGNA